MRYSEGKVTLDRQLHKISGFQTGESCDLEQVEH